MALGLYWNGRYEYPRNDQIAFLLESRAYDDELLPWVGHSLSYNRNRVLNVGDGYLFRPALHGLLAIEEWLTRRFPGAIGYFSILTFAGLAFALYLLLSRFLSARLSFAVSLLALCQVGGTELVLFRHISGYQLALLFSFLALRQRRLRWAAPALLAAFLFHEFTAIAAAGVFCIGRFYQKTPDRLVRWMGPAFLLFLAANVLDLVFHFPATGLFGSVDQGSAGGFAYGWKSTMEVLGYSLGKVMLPLAELPVEALFALVLMVLTALGVMIYRRRAHFRRREYAALFAVGCLMAIAFGVGFGRLSFRGIQYLFTHGSYYFGLTSFLYLLILGYLLSFIKRAPIQTAVATVLIALAAVQAFAVRAIVDSSYPAQANLLVRSASDLRAALVVHPEQCLLSRYVLGEDGNFIGYVAHSKDLLPSVSGLLPFYLREFECSLRRDAKSGQIIVETQGRHHLVSASLVAESQVPRQRVDADKELLAQIGPLQGRSWKIQLLPTVVIGNEEALSFFSSSINPKVGVGIGRTGDQVFLVVDGMVMSWALVGREMPSWAIKAQRRSDVSTIHAMRLNLSSQLNAKIAQKIK